MNRKGFLGWGLAGLAGWLFPVTARAGYEEGETALKRPPYLKPGDTIGITSPAGHSTAEEMQPALKLMESWGYRIRIGKAIGKKEFTRGGTDEERLADLQELLDDPSIRAIMCARGGYGSVRIVDRINWTAFKEHPKWIIGFSDITVLHNHVHTLGVASIHSKMTNSFPDDWTRAEDVQIQTILSIQDALAGKKMHYTATPAPMNRQGRGEGVLIGGNLRIIENLAGTPSDLHTDGKILFVEDTGEYLYSIDRMFWNLKRTGKLKKLKGLIIGGFRVKPDDPGDEFGKVLEEIVLEKVKDYSYPVCFDFPVGHQKANYALKCGVKHRLTVADSEVTLSEIV